MQKRSGCHRFQLDPGDGCFSKSNGRWFCVMVKGVDQPSEVIIQKPKPKLKMSSHSHLGECRLCEMCNTCVGHPELPADPTYHFAIQGKHIHSHLVCIVPRLCKIENVDESFFWSDRTRFNTYLVSTRDHFKA